jgi:hypothetical protein
MLIQTPLLISCYHATIFIFFQCIHTIWNTVLENVVGSRKTGQEKGVVNSIGKQHWKMVLENGIGKQCRKQHWKTALENSIGKQCCKTGIGKMALENGIGRTHW